MERMGLEPILSFKLTVTIETMINFKELCFSVISKKLVMLAFLYCFVMRSKINSAKVYLQSGLNLRP